MAVDREFDIYFGPHGGPERAFVLKNMSCKVFWEPNGSLWVAWEGVMGAPREPLGGLGHLLGAGPMLDSIFRENVKSLCFTQFGRRRGCRSGSSGSTGSTGSGQNEARLAV